VVFAGVVKVFVVADGKSRSVEVETAHAWETAGRERHLDRGHRGSEARRPRGDERHSLLADGTPVRIRAPREDSASRRRREPWDVCIRRPVFTTMLVAAPLVLDSSPTRGSARSSSPTSTCPCHRDDDSARGERRGDGDPGDEAHRGDREHDLRIDELRSTTKEGISQVTIQFVLEKNGAVAAQEVDAKVRTILTELPVGTDPPSSTSSTSMRPRHDDRGVRTRGSCAR
jgi:hypothetical protein